MLAWIGFAGIVLDFVGVVILTLDILPEFLLHRREQRLRQLKLNTGHLNDGDGARPQYDGDQQLYDTIQGALDLVNATNASLYNQVQFSFGTAQAALRNSAYDFNATDDGRVKAALAEPVFKREAFDEALAVLRDKSDNAHANLAHRRRPNLSWGVFFVLMGFILQAFGAMPTYAQTAVISGIAHLLGAPHR